MLGEQVTWGGHGRGSGRFLLGHIYYTPHTGWRQSPRERTLSHANQTSCKFQTTLRAGDTAGADCRVPQATEEPVVGDPLGQQAPDTVGSLRAVTREPTLEPTEGLHTARMGHTPPQGAILSVHSVRYYCVTLFILNCHLKR